MVNLLWAGIIVIAIVIAGINGKVNTITPIIFSSAENAVNISLSMISIMAFWLGIMKIIEKSGFIHLVIFFLKPLAYWLFPGIPRNHRAMNSMLMNMSANLLGMGNAATPFGIKAMEEMQQLNPDRDTASDNMCFSYQHCQSYLDSYYNYCHQVGYRCAKPHGHCRDYDHSELMLHNGSHPRRQVLSFLQQKERARCNLQS